MNGTGNKKKEIKQKLENREKTPKHDRSCNGWSPIRQLRRTASQFHLETPCGGGRSFVHLIDV